MSYETYPGAEVFPTDNPDFVAEIKQISRVRYYWRIVNIREEGWANQTVVIHWAKTYETAKERLKSGLAYRGLSLI